jgi:hypothetical protein
MRLAAFCAPFSSRALFVYLLSPTVLPVALASDSTIPKEEKRSLRARPRPVWVSGLASITNLIGRLLGLMTELPLSDVAVSDGPDTRFNIST